MPLSQMKVLVVDDASVHLYVCFRGEINTCITFLRVYVCIRVRINAWIPFYVCVCILGGINTCKSNK